MSSLSVWLLFLTNLTATRASSKRRSAVSFNITSLLGHVVSSRGIECDPERQVTIATWPTPTSILEVQTFCDLARYYCTFVKDFAAKARPLHNLLRREPSLAGLWSARLHFLT